MKKERSNNTQGQIIAWKNLLFSFMKVKQKQFEVHVLVWLSLFVHTRYLKSNRDGPTCETH